MRNCLMQQMHMMVTTKTPGMSSISWADMINDRFFPLPTISCRSLDCPVGIYHTIFLCSRLLMLVNYSICSICISWCLHAFVSLLALETLTFSPIFFLSYSTVFFSILHEYHSLDDVKEAHEAHETVIAMMIPFNYINY